MQENKSNISDVSIIGLRVQGYLSCSVKQLADYRLGIRFATGICAGIILLGLIFQNAIFYYIGLAISIGGMIPPRHPVDYLYNGIIRHIFNKPALPLRPAQSRFACSIASLWMIAVVICWHNNYFWISSALAGALVMQAGIVTFTDICFPSMIYNFFNSRKSMLKPEPKIVKETASQNEKNLDPILK